MDDPPCLRDLQSLLMAVSQCRSHTMAQVVGVSRYSTLVRSTSRAVLMVVSAPTDPFTNIASLTPPTAAKSISTAKLVASSSTKLVPVRSIDASAADVTPVASPPQSTPTRISDIAEHQPAMPNGTPNAGATSRLHAAGGCCVKHIWDVGPGPPGYRWDAVQNVSGCGGTSWSVVVVTVVANVTVSKNEDNINNKKRRRRRRTWGDCQKWQDVAPKREHNR